MDKTSNEQIAKWERTGKCIQCGGDRVKNRRICKSYHSKQVSSNIRNNKIKQNKTFNCLDCWKDFPEYRKSQKRCKKCYLEYLSKIMKEKHKNKDLTITS